MFVNIEYKKTYNFLFKLNILILGIKNKINESCSMLSKISKKTHFHKKSWLEIINEFL